MMKRGFRLVALVPCLGVPATAWAQDDPETIVVADHQPVEGASGPGQPGRPPSVFDGDWFTIGLGVGVGPSYDGSDDYRVLPAPVLQGRIGGVRLVARPAGLAADLVPEGEGRITYNLGPAFRLRSDRANQIKDEVVKLAGELDHAFEVGISGGIGVKRVLRRGDNLSFDLDIGWDVAGAHSGRVISPSIGYFAPLSRGMAGNFTVSAQFVDDAFADYYYSVNAEQSAASGLAPFQAEGGLNSIGANALLIIDFDGNLANGGFAGVVIGGYSRLQGDAADTPYTSERGSANQLFGAVGIAYTF